MSVCVNVFSLLRQITGTLVALSSQSSYSSSKKQLKCVSFYFLHETSDVKVEFCKWQMEEGWKQN